MKKMHLALLCASLISIAGCKPSGPPPDIVKTQREGMDKAKAVEGQMQNRAGEANKAADSQSDK